MSLNFFLSCTNRIYLITDNNKLKQRYIYTTNKLRSENKDMLIKFFLSPDVHSLCNTTHNNKQNAPITGYRRQLHKDKYVNQWLGHHRPSPQNDGHDER